MLLNAPVQKLRHTSRWPFRQGDPAWRNDKMWDRKKMAQVHHQYNGAGLEDAQEEFNLDGDTIETQGCLLTCLAMTLRMLARGGKKWTPARLNTKARKGLFYSDAGLSNVALYSDLVADVSNGEVQLCMQEQYLAGESGLPAKYASECSILRGYRKLPYAQRRDFIIMLKIGTHDDSFASHYVLVDPDEPGGPDENNVPLLDPDQPRRPRASPWLLSDSYRRLRQNKRIRGRLA